MIKIALFASGSGTNVENIVKHFESIPDIQIDRVYCNKSNAYVLERADYLGIDSRVFDRDALKNGTITQELLDRETDLIVLAGFLLLIPADLVEAFPDKIINIHPALLPNYGGKGMYGHHVHEAVIKNGDKESGITIHLVNQEYDKGRVLFQAKTEIVDGDNPDTLAAKIHALEKRHFPRVIEDYIRASKL